MAYVIHAIDLCFIHIPKTSGTWTKRCLCQVSHGERDKSVVHGFPVRWDYDRIFTVYRDPADWLASVFAHRIRNRWETYKAEVPWKHFCSIIDDCQDTRFEPFAEKVCTKHPGIVGWLFELYSPPGVEVYKVGPRLNSFLSSLGCKPEILAPVNVGYKVPTPSDEIREMVAISEIKLYNHYAFDPP